MTALSTTTNTGTIADKRVHFQILPYRLEEEAPAGMNFQEEATMNLEDFQDRSDWAMTTPPSSPSKRIIYPAAAALDRLVRESSLLSLSFAEEDEIELDYEQQEPESSPASQEETYRHHVLGEQRQPWNSPDALDRRHRGGTMMNQHLLVPPPPPPPRRPIRFASLENFHPTPIFGRNFPDPTPQEENHGSLNKRSSSCWMMDDDDLDCKENEMESSYNHYNSSSTGGPLRKKPKLAMKKSRRATTGISSGGNQYHARRLVLDDKPDFSVKGILARMVA